MNRDVWKTVIKEACIKAETYQSFFDPVIDTLSGILEKRDDAERYFTESGGEIIVEHTNKGGNTNLEQNPTIRLINDLNRDALAYWRDLGLTPAGLKRINDTMLSKPKASPLAEALKAIG